MEKIRKFLFVNSNEKQTVIKNTFWVLVGEFANRLLRMALIVYAVRMLGANEWGVFSYAFSLGSLLVVFADVGIGNLLTREITGVQKVNSSLISALFFTKGVLLFLSSILIIALAPVLSHIGEANTLFPVIALVFLLDSLRELGFSINRAYQRMEREMAVKTVMGILTLIVGMFLLRNSATSKSLLATYAIGSGIGLVMILFLVKKHVTELFSKINLQDIKIVLRIIAPFSLVAICTIVMSNIDIYMLGIWKDPVEIGLYNSAQRIYQFILIIPTAFASATLPLMSQLALTEKERFGELVSNTLLTVLAVTIPLAVGGIALSKDVIVFVFGAGYADAAFMFSILMLLAVVTSIFLIISNAILAHNAQRQLAIAYGIGMTANILLNFLLIPTLGAEGAAFSILCTTTIATAITWNKLKQAKGPAMLPKLQKILISSLIMYFGVMLMKHLEVNVLTNIACAVIVYSVSLYMLKEPLLQELKNILNI